MTAPQPNILDRAYGVLKARGPMRGSALGWELWGETTAVSERGIGVHQRNKFCRAAGSVLRRLEKQGRVRQLPIKHGTSWKAI